MAGKMKSRRKIGKHIYTNLPNKKWAMDISKYQAAAKLTPKEFEGVEKLVKAGYYLNISDFVRSAVRDKLEAMKPVLVRRISPKVAQDEVFRYIKSHPDVYPDEIADVLNLDIETVMDAVAALMSKGKIGESA